MSGNPSMVTRMLASAAALHGIIVDTCYTREIARANPGWAIASRFCPEVAGIAEVGEALGGTITQDAGSGFRSEVAGAPPAHVDPGLASLAGAAGSGDGAVQVAGAPKVRRRPPRKGRTMANAPQPPFDKDTWRKLIRPALRIVDSLETKGYGKLDFRIGGGTADSNVSRPPIPI